MKKTLIILNVLIALSIILYASSVIAAQTTTRPAKINDVVVTLINQEPDPVEPGRYVDVRFKFDNNGSGEAKNVIVEIIPSFPFSLEPGKSATRSIGTLQSRQRGDVGVIVKYRLIVDKDAIEGDNELKIRYKEEGYDWIGPEEFFVDIRTSDAILSIDSVTVDTSTLKPGKSGTVTIGVSNRGDSLLGDIKANLGISGVPLVPIGSSNEKTTYQIGSKESYDFKFNLLAEPDATSGVYKVPLKITYKGPTGNYRSANGTIGLTIGDKPDLSITIDEATVYQQGKTGEVTVKVVNKGVTDIKFVNIKLPKSENYRIISNNEVYLGNIDSDDFETASFDIFVEKTRDDKIELPFEVSYKDANNNDFIEIIKLQLKLYSTSEAKKFGLKEGNGFVGNLIIIIIVVAGIFFYRKYRKKKKKA